MFKIGTSWVRGIVGEGLTSELAVRFGCAFGSWADGDTVVLGMDSRNSSPMLKSAVISGLMYSGCRIMDLDLCPTPLISFAVRELGASGGISISGSHNDSRWNALKFIGPDGVLLGTDKSEELLDIFHASDFSPDPERLFNQEIIPVDLTEEYLAHLTSFVDAEKIKKESFTVAVDFRFGTCCKITEKLMEKLGCRLVKLNPEALLPAKYAPAPGSVNMSDLSCAVLESKADIGAAINVDGDRLSFVTESGRILSEEMTLPLVAINRLGRRSGPIVTNYSTSSVIDWLAEKHETNLIRTQVGEAHVMNRGLEEGAILAGEGSGGVAALPVTMTYDGLLSLEMVLETMATTGRTTEDFTREFPRFFMKKEEIFCHPSNAYRTLELFRLSQENIDPECGDGVRLTVPDGWVHVRVSDTESLIRVIAETGSEKTVSDLFERTVRQIRSALTENFEGRS
ncbi:MAG: hypothetical protein ABIJ42_05025 [Acidobacteriota bacterium]